MPGKHGPNRLAKDLAVHKRAMADLVDEGFVVEDQCQFTFQRRAVLLQGTILCLGGITLEVEKEIAVLKGSGMTAQVQTTAFDTMRGFVAGTTSFATSRGTSAVLCPTSTPTTPSAMESRGVSRPAVARAGVGRRAGPNPRLNRCCDDSLGATLRGTPRRPCALLLSRACTTLADEPAVCNRAAGRGGASIESVSAEVFVQVGPMHAVAAADESVLAALFGSRGLESIRPMQRHAHDPTVGKGRNDGLIADLD